MSNILISIPDLMFETRIADAVRKLGHRAETYNAEKIAGANLIIIGLENNRNWRAVADNAQTQIVPILAFAGHTRAELLREARNAGCTRVVVNSDISENLPRLLEETLTTKSPGHEGH